MRTIDYLTEFAEYISAILGIEAPEIKFAPFDDDGSTIRGGMAHDGSELVVQTRLDLQAEFEISDVESLDTLLRTCHELRHLWQLHKRPDLLEGYQPRDVLELIPYNRQPAEIDAHAFSAVIMAANFRVDPLFQGFDEDTKVLIKKRADEVYNELNEGVETDDD